MYSLAPRSLSAEPFPRSLPASYLFSAMTGAVYKKIYAVIRRIPPGRVATYAQVAALAGLPGRARQVGFALRNLPEGSTVPWQRVVNAGGGISSRGGGWEEGYQRHLLQEEGVVFTASGRIDLDRFGWDA